MWGRYSLPFTSSQLAADRHRAQTANKGVASRAEFNVGAREREIEKETRQMRQRNRQRGGVSRGVGAPVKHVSDSRFAAMAARLAKQQQQVASTQPYTQYALPLRTVCPMYNH